jgi:putative ABC transport system permease protein
LDKTLHDIRYALRAMKQSPGFSAIAIATLAIGIAANVTIFTVVNAVVLKSLPYAEPEQLIAIDETIPSQNLDSAGVSYPNYLDWKKSIKAIQDIGVFSERNITLVTGEGGVRISGAEVSTNMFSLLGVDVAMGRGFQAQDGLPSSQKVALISDVLWRNRFAADLNIPGTVVKINGQPTTVIGVMPPRFRFPETGDIWIPVEGREIRGSHYLNAIGRMKPGITIEQAKAEMQGIHPGPTRDASRSSHCIEA